LRKENVIEMRVRDNGGGFDSKIFCEGGQRERTGWASMKERVESLSGLLLSPKRERERDPLGGHEAD
jgi:signal transduction histidine kinase